MAPDRLEDLLAGLAAAGYDESDPTSLCRLGATATGMSGAGVLLMDDGRILGSLWPTGDTAARVDDLQYALGEGPSVDADRTGRLVGDVDLDAPAVHRWPVLTPALLEAEVRALVGVPVRIGSVRLGALTLHRASPGPLDPDQITVALLSADLLARAILDLQAAAPPGSVAAELAQGANLHVAVHQAAGMLSVQLACSVAEALVRLRAHAFRTDRPIDDVARDVVDHGLTLDDLDDR